MEILEDARKLQLCLVSGALHLFDKRTQRIDSAFVVVRCALLFLFFFF